MTTTVMQDAAIIGTLERERCTQDAEHAFLLSDLVNELRGILPDAPSFQIGQVALAIAAGVNRQYWRSLNSYASDACCSLGSRILSAKRAADARAALGG